jgi:outer membrane protein assembly factor BamA
MHRTAILLLMFVILAPGAAQAQEPAPPAAGPPDFVPPEQEVDVFDLWRRVRGTEQEPAPWDYRKPMRAFAPVIGAKPSAGLMLGAAGNVAFYRGDPATTRISAAVASLTFSTKGQTSLGGRFTMFTRDDRWRVEGDYRLQWTSIDTHALGTAADTRTGVVADYNFFRLYQTAYYRLRPGLFAGGGVYFDNHTDVGPAEGEEAAWPDSPYVQYSEAAGLPLDAQISAGPGLDVLWDNRDSVINAERGWLARGSYRMAVERFLSSDVSWQRVGLDVRVYNGLSTTGRHTIATWVYSDLIVGGTAPYFDLPGTALDTYGRSARGYSEGQFRGEKLAYGEVEYRGTLTRNGLLGMVAFLNTTTVANLGADEPLFDSFATAGGAGLRLLINKRSKTNLCFDIAFGQQGSKGVYLAIQEAF